MKTKKQYVEIEKIDWSFMTFIIIGIILTVIGLHDAYGLDSNNMFQNFGFSSIIVAGVGILIIAIGLSIDKTKMIKLYIKSK